MFLIAAAFVVCELIGYVLVSRISKRRGKQLSRPRTILVSTACALALLAFAGFGYLEVYSHADSDAREALVADELVAVTHEGNVYCFDGPGTDVALVFYPGGKVEATAYAPLMRALAERGVDCFLVEMPFRMAPLGANAADGVIASHDYDRWIMAGHSLGGAFAAAYTAGHADKVDGLVLLGAYPTKDLPDSLVFCSIIGAEDGVCDRAAYEKGKAYWPPQSFEVVIEGGNHAQFGNYGSQAGDNAATISAAAQQEQTVDAVLKLVASMEG